VTSPRVRTPRTVIGPGRASTSIVFSAAGGYVRGFGHESAMSPYGNDGEPWPAVIDEVPEAFRPFVRDPDQATGATLEAPSLSRTLLPGSPSDTQSICTVNRMSLSPGSNWRLSCSGSLAETLREKFTASALSCPGTGRTETGDAVKVSR
jgi:hypothetical protein